MTKEELEKIVSRANDASPGPFTIDVTENGECRIYSKYLRCVAQLTHPLEHQRKLDAEFVAQAQHDIIILGRALEMSWKKIEMLENLDCSYVPRDMNDAMRIISLQRERIYMLARQAQGVAKPPVPQLRSITPQHVLQGQQRKKAVS